MYGAFALPKICPRLWFSITIVNTVPPQWVGACGCACVTGSQVANVLPDVFAQPATTSEPRMTPLECLNMPGQSCARRYEWQARMYIRATIPGAHRVEARRCHVPDKLSGS